MKSENPHQNHDDITSSKRLLAPALPINLSVFFFRSRHHCRRRFTSKDRIVPLSFCRSSPLRFYYEVDPDGPALKTPVKPLIRSGKIKLHKMRYFFCYLPSSDMVNQYNDDEERNF